MAQRPKVRYGRGRPNDFQRATAGFLLDIALEMQNFLQLNNRVASGHAINSFEIDVESLRKGGAVGETFATLSAAGYIAFSLQGREGKDTRPENKYPPFDEIRNWVAIKGFQVSEKYPTLDEVAKAMQITIGELGTNNPHMTSEEVEVIIDIAWDKWGDRLADGYAEQIADVIVRALTKQGYEQKR